MIPAPPNKIKGKLLFVNFSNGNKICSFVEKSLLSRDKGKLFFCNKKVNKTSQKVRYSKQKAVKRKSTLDLVKIKEKTINKKRIELNAF